MNERISKGLRKHFRNELAEARRAGDVTKEAQIYVSKSALKTLKHERHLANKIRSVSTSEINL